MKFSHRTTLIAGATLFLAGFASAGTANAQGSYFDKYDGKTLKELRGEVESRLKSNSNSNIDKPKIKFDCARVRAILDQYMPRN